MGTIYKKRPHSVAVGSEMLLQTILNTTGVCCLRDDVALNLYFPKCGLVGLSGVHDQSALHCCRHSDMFTSAC